MTNLRAAIALGVVVGATGILALGTGGKVTPGPAAGGGAGWQTVYDCDFSKMPAGDLPTDGGVTLCGLRWEELNFTSVETPVAISPDAGGLAIRPTYDTEWFGYAGGGWWTAPALRIPLTSIKGMDLGTPFRMWVWISSFEIDLSTSYASAQAGVYLPGEAAMYFKDPEMNSGAYSGSAWVGTGGGHIGPVWHAYQNVLVLERPIGSTAITTSFLSGTYGDAGWPAASELKFFANVVRGFDGDDGNWPIGGYQYNQAPTESLGNWYLVLTVARHQNSHQMQVTFGRVRLDIKP